MLTSGHVIVEYDFTRRLVKPDRLTQKSHGHYLEFADKMLSLYREGVGLTRMELHQRVERIFDDEPCHARRITSFCKLLDDASEYHTDNGRKAARMRIRVFSLASKMHPLVSQKQTETLFGSLENEESVAKQEIADSLGLPWQKIDELLYADVISFHRLKAPPQYDDAAAFLSHYNVAQTQAALYKAQSATIRATDDFKTILRYIKLFGLLHDISQIDPSTYVIHLDGPASVLRNTTRYGVRFAKLLPVLLTCEGWQFSAKFKTKRGNFYSLDLSPKNGLRSILDKPPMFDSGVEESFAQKFGEVREGWKLIREGAILHRHQKTFVPDFVFRHEDGREVLFEIVGFWTPEYLMAKLETLKEFSDQSILLAVCENEGAVETFEEWNDRIVPYKTGIKLGPVLEKLNLFGS